VTNERPRRRSREGERGASPARRGCVSVEEPAGAASLAVDRPAGEAPAARCGSSPTVRQSSRVSLPDCGRPRRNSLIQADRTARPKRRRQVRLREEVAQWCKTPHGTRGKLTRVCPDRPMPDTKNRLWTVMCGAKSNRKRTSSKARTVEEEPVLKKGVRVSPRPPIE